MAQLYELRRCVVVSCAVLKTVVFAFQGSNSQTCRATFMLHDKNHQNVDGRMTWKETERFYRR